MYFWACLSFFAERIKSLFFGRWGPAPWRARIRGPEETTAGNKPGHYSMSNVMAVPRDEESRPPYLARLVPIRIYIQPSSKRRVA